MKKIFLLAYDGVNLGDDLFIETIITRYRNTKFYMISDQVNRKNFSSYQNLVVINKNNFLLKKLKNLWPGGYSRYESYIKNKCNALVYIGGSIFIEYSSWRNILNWWNYQVDRYPFYVLGANFGPFKEEEYLKSMEKMYLHLEDICFRDKMSFDLFEKNEKIRYAPDILFSYKMNEKEEKKQVFFSVINCENKDEGRNTLSKYGNEYVDVMIRIIKKYLNNGYSVVVSSFCKIEGDEETVTKIKKSCKDIKVLNYNGNNRQEILDSISESCYMIGTRFHSIILGLDANKPVFPIIYSIKTENMLKDIGFNGNYINIRDIEQLDYEFSKKNLDDKYIIDISRFKMEAENHFKKLDEVLKK